MKKLILIIIIYSLSSNCYSQTPATKEHIRTLLEMIGSGKIGVQVMENMLVTFKKTVPNVPNEFWDEYMKEVKPDTLIDLIIPVYAKYYTDEDVTQLIDFYRTPLGKKVIEKLPLITQESYLIGAEWGKKLGEKAFKMLKEKGYLQSN
ncbi:hypothetical protein A3860_29920 [Niastella vici]|uniref:DUF2059 domain-containing protein n=1 Tax=Niastella vici TaxID=1703345 RepID=A0A1V9FU81_9BACT|nr:DUF2059 domain-containing protein [Niastella vici]OQP61915.1 hypothetical protein A3860_29920 [Niastella vici]